MEAYFSYLNELVNKNVSSFRKFDGINWLSSYNAEAAEQQRKKITDGFSESVTWDFGRTKPWINSISKGCQLCGSGEWSCLFITGKCNAKCFYCPARQDQEDLPMAQRLTFEDPYSYADFINHFGFKGVSFSGGEPFLAFDKVLEFTRVLRKECDPDIYIWLYTNGILGTQEKYDQLAKLGLNEVRFDLGATHYNIETVERASNTVPQITIEIPAVPEDLERLTSLLPNLVKAGVTNINLHQLRLTEYNAEKLLKRSYTFLHGEQPSVFESELCALRIIEYVKNNQIPIGINYCTFQFKNRYQKAGYRNKVLRGIGKDYQPTENGFLIKILDPEKNEIPLKDLLEKSVSFHSIYIVFEGYILNDIPKQGDEPMIAGRKKLFIEKGNPVSEITITSDKIPSLKKILTGSAEMPVDKDLFTIWRMWNIEKGLRMYF